ARVGQARGPVVGGDDGGRAVVAGWTGRAVRCPDPLTQAALQPADPAILQVVLDARALAHRVAEDDDVRRLVPGPAHRLRPRVEDGVPVEGAGRGRRR